MTSAAPDTTRIRVLFLIGTLDIGGAERQFVEIATHLDPMFEPAVCCLSAAGPLAADLERAGIPVLDAGLRGFRQQRGLAKVRAALGVPVGLLRLAGHVRRFKPHVVHGVLFHAYVLAALIGAPLRVPVIIASRRSLSHFKESRASYRLVEQMANRLTDAVVANSEAVRADAIRTEGLAPATVSVIHNGLESRVYRRTDDGGVRASIEALDAPLAITIANLIPYKGHTYLLQAWKQVCARVPNAVLALAGDGPARSALEEQARSLGIARQVRFLGLRRDVPELLAAADVLVHPSLEEGFCNALLEAMAAGRPVVATDVGGNPEAVISGETGWLVPPRDSRALADAICRVFQADDRGAGMGAAGQRLVDQRFGRDDMVRRYEALYREQLRRKGVDVTNVRDRRTV